MAGFIAKFITKKILEEKISNNFGKEDPYFESVPATRLNGTPTGKVKKRRKALPPGVTDHDGKVLTKVKRRAWRLDMCLFNLCGIQFGWGSAIGLIPAVGDAIDALMALMVYRTCCSVEDGLPASVKAKMMLNIIFDFALGLVPFIGDVADAAFRCNTKNAVLLEEYLRERGQKNLRKNGQPIPAIDPSESGAFDRYREEGQDSGGDAVGRQPQRNKNMGSRRNNDRADIENASPTNAPENDTTAPAKADGRAGQRSGSRSWFGWARSKPRDVEMNEVEAERRQGSA